MMHCLAHMFRPFVIAITLLAPAFAGAVCGPFPSTWPAWSGSKLATENGIKVNLLNVAAGESTGSYGVNVTSGAKQAVSLTLPTLDPATYPTFSGGNNLTSPASVSPGTYGTVTVSNTTPGVDTFLTGGGTYYIDTLSVSGNAGIQMGAGNYFIRNLSLASGAQITVGTGGAVRILVNSNMNWGGSNLVNDGGSATNMQIYLYPGATSAALNNNTRFTGLMVAPLATQSITTGDNSTVTGALFAGGTLTLKNNTVFNSTATVQAQIAAISSCSAVLVAQYRFDETSWGSGAGVILDSSGSGRNATAIGSPLPVPASTTPALTGNPGTCGYGVFAGPLINGGAVRMTSLPVNTAVNARNSVSLWLNWNYSATGVVMGWNAYDLYYSGSTLGFNSLAGDWFLANISGAPRWVHVVGIFTNGNQALSELYIDGVKLALALSGSANNTNAYATTTMYIGAMGALTSFRLTGANVDEVKVFTGTLTDEQILALRSETHACVGTGPHHLENSDSTGGNGLTCSPSTLTIRACADAACSSLYTGGLTGTLSMTPVSGASTANWGGATPNFTIAAGSGSVTKTLQLTSDSATVSATIGATSAATASVSCTFASCLYTARSTGFAFDIPNNVAATSNSVTIAAVRTSDNASVCVPAFANVSKTVLMGCTYQDPNSGTLPVVVNGTALNPGNNVNSACISTAAINLSFNGSGQATANFSYADVGLMGVSMIYNGSAASNDAGLVMTGTDTFIAGPQDILISGLPAAPLTAGTPFNTTVTARNSLGAATPNFGRESAAATVTLTSSNPVPGLGNATAINTVFTGFSGGLASRNLTWAEVGTIDLAAEVNNYQGSGISATGSLTGAGRFKSAYFSTTVTQGCQSGNYTYSGQPFSVTTTAYATTGNITANYGGATWAKATTLSAVPGTSGTLTNASVAATEFAGGLATHTATFTFTSARTVPTTLALRATDTDLVTSQGGAGGEGTALLRSGRWVLRSNYGSELMPLLLPLETQFWQEGGNTASSSDDYWTVNTSDSCTSLSAAAVTLGNFRPGVDPGLKSGETSISSISSMSAGRATLTLAAPGATNSGSVDLTINPVTAGIPWLAAPPVARATFGLRKSSVIHMRENF